MSLCIVHILTARDTIASSMHLFAPGSSTSAQLEIHPLDWLSHLRQLLVFEPVPTFMTLLIVSTHFYACCSGVQPHDPKHEAAHSNGNSEKSFLGSTFAALSWGASKLTTLLQRGSVQTPFGKKRHYKGQGSSKGGSDDHSSGEQAESSSPPDEAAAAATFADQIISAAMTDPVTMMFDTWSYFSSGDAHDNDHHAGPKQEYRAAPLDAAQCSRHSSRQTGSMPSPDKDHEQGTWVVVDVDQADENFRQSWLLDAWMDICTMHMVGMASLVFMLLPSIANQSMLACNAIPQVNASAWPVLNSGLCILGISWTWCCAMHFSLGMPMLALCTGMHSVGRIMLAYACTALSCPLPPIFMPGAVASGMALFVGFHLLFISQMHHGIQQDTAKKGHGHVQIFGTADFYMNHAWACVCVLLCIRHLAFRGVLWMQACFVPHVYAESS